MGMQQAYDYRLPWQYRSNMQDRNKSVLLFTCTDSTSFIGTRESSSCTKRRDYSVSLWCYLTFVDKTLKFNFVYVIFGNDS